MSKQCPNSFDELEYIEGFSDGIEKGHAQGFAEGWDACLKALCKMPLDKAFDKLADYADKMLNEEKQKTPCSKQSSWHRQNTSAC